MHSRRRCILCCAEGLSLIELVGVVAIMGILVVLLLPAVLRSRESARAAACLNNLHQLGIALQSHHAAHGAFPDGHDANQWGYGVRLLPYLDQKSLAARVAFKIPCMDAAQRDGDRSVAACRLSVFECPADPMAGYSRSRPFGTFVIGNYFGVMGTRTQLKNGVLFPGSHIPLAAVRDGGSNTLIVGERAGIPVQPLGCWACGEGQNWSGDAEHLLTTQFPLGEGDDHYKHLFHFWSHHNGGTLFLFVDGSAKCLSIDLELRVLQALSTRAGNELDGPL